MEDVDGEIEDLQSESQGPEAEPEGGRNFEDEEERDFINAKAYLLTSSDKSDLNLYDQLAAVLTKILNERPEDPVDLFEEFSTEAKKTKFTPTGDTIQDKLAKTAEIELAEIQLKLYSKGDGEKPIRVEDLYADDVVSPLPNLHQIAYFLEQSCVGLNRTEMFRIWLSLKQLLEDLPLETIRFWGKIFGIENNYIVAEVEFRQGEDELEREFKEEASMSHPDSARDTKAETIKSDVDDDDDGLPLADYKQVPKPPREENRTGTNKKTYYVCSEPGKPWTRLPLVTPEQICVARKIKKFFTGHLEREIVSYPPFDGNEANYLRAQIARISAGTHISPLNFYTFEEDEEIEEEESREDYGKNPDFEVINFRDLVDPSLANWVHHVQHILPQGRCTWWNTVQKTEEDDEDDEASDDAPDEEPDEPIRETGPPLLTPLSEDAEVNNTPAWTPKRSLSFIPQYTFSVLHSNLWPGAHAFCYEKIFENIYIGFGHKYSAENFDPELPPPVQEELPSGPEITEIEDPTPLDEAAMLAAKLEAEEVAEEAEEEEDDDDD